MTASLHFALTPEDLVPALALALLAGLRGVTHGRRTLFVLPAAWLLGGVIGLAAHGGVSSIWTASSFVLLGGLVALDARLPLGATTLLAALLGLGHGYLNGSPWLNPPLARWHSWASPPPCSRSSRSPHPCGPAPRRLGPPDRPSGRQLDRRHRVAPDRLGASHACVTQARLAGTRCEFELSTMASASARSRSPWIGRS